jgi:hypothetical protein
MAITIPNNEEFSGGNNAGHSDPLPARKLERIQPPDHRDNVGRMAQPDSLIGHAAGAIPIRPCGHEGIPLRKGR